jgi:hypothetical protein
MMTAETRLTKMDEQELKELLHSRRNRRYRLGWSCPDEMQLTAYVDRGLDIKTRESLEAHFADCDSCLGQLAFLVHSDRWEDPVEVPPQLLAKAKHLVSNHRRTFFSGWRWAAVTAAAACLLITSTIILTVALRRSAIQPSAKGPGVAQQDPGQYPAGVSQDTPAPRNPDVVAGSNTPSSARTNSSRPEPSVPLVRNAEPDHNAPTVTFPREGSTVQREKLEFRWQTVSDAVFYDLTIVTAAGDPVISRQTDRTQLELPPDVHLMSNAKYFVSVRAHLREGKTARSSVVSFRVAE